jgi:hypothetical protein
MRPPSWANTAGDLPGMAFEGGERLAVAVPEPRRLINRGEYCTQPDPFGRAGQTAGLWIGGLAATPRLVHQGLPGKDSSLWTPFRPVGASPSPDRLWESGRPARLSTRATRRGPKLSQTVPASCGLIGAGLVIHRIYISRRPTFCAMNDLRFCCEMRQGWLCRPILRLLFGT